MGRNRGKDQVCVFNHTVSRSIKKKEIWQVALHPHNGEGCGEFGLNALSSANIMATLTVSVPSMIGWYTVKRGLRKLVEGGW